MGGKRVEPAGHYELRDSASLTGLVEVWWCPVNGTPAKTNMTLGEDRVMLMAEAFADWELRHVDKPDPEPKRAAGGLRIVRDDD
jgi:hypothetical protein